MSTIEELEITSKRIRKSIITMLAEAGSGHPGGSLSVTDILVTLYDYIKINPENPKWEDRDRVVLSKGHAAPALYAVLADKGFYDSKEFSKLRKLGGKLQGHPDMNKTPGVDVCTGTLGNGFSTAIGMALAGKVQKKEYHVYAILGDGELQEGVIWEAAMAAAHYKLENLTVILDHNGMQIDGLNDEVMTLGNVRAKFEAFGYEVIELDGHNIGELQEAYKIKTLNKPVCIIANTQKGKGISFMEGKVEWHGNAINQETYQLAMAELEGGK